MSLPARAVTPVTASRAAMTRAITLKRSLTVTLDTQTPPLQ